LAAVTGDRYPRAVHLGLFLVALVMRLPNLARRELVEGDGVHYASLARGILIGDLSGLANPYWSNLWPGVTKPSAVRAARRSKTAKSQK
jgi:hypothetical protein